MALHRHKSKLSGKASFGIEQFQESLHPRGPGGKFKDKPGAGNDAPKKPRTKGASSASEASSKALTPGQIGGSHVLSIVAKGNPKKGAAASRYALYKEGMAVDDYVSAVEKAGLGNKKQALRDLAWDAKQGWIKLAPSKVTKPTGPGAGLAAGALASSPVVAPVAAPEPIVLKSSAEKVAEAELAPKAPFDADKVKADSVDSADMSQFDYNYGAGSDFQFMKKFGQGINKAPPDDGQLMSVKYYTTDEGYTGINGNLRDGLPLTKQQQDAVDNVDALIEKGQVYEDVVLHRVLNGPDAKAAIENLKPGDAWVSSSYTSTTLHPDAAESLIGEDPTWIRILAREKSKAYFVEPYTANNGELEVILPRGAKLVYAGKVDGVHTFEYADAVKKADLGKIDDLPALGKVAGTGVQSTATPGVTVFSATSLATPTTLAGVDLKSWDAPTTTAGWAGVSGQKTDLVEPPMNAKGKSVSTGLIVHEPDGRVWIVKPTNGYGGYEHTFPKGGLEPGLSMQANAIKETYEESGLKARVFAFAGDHEGATSVTRYYHAVREAGTPLDKGWESEAVLLVDPKKLDGFLNTARDKKILADNILSNNPAAEHFAAGNKPGPILKEAVAAPKPPGSLGNPISTDGFKKTGDQMGSNPGGTYTGPDGEKYYLKESKSLEHAENELLATDLYGVAGMKTLDPQAYTVKGKIGTGTKIQKLDTFDPNNSLHVAAAQEDFATHAWLANWDAVGLEYDNLAFVGGKITALDAGGALKYRAMGGLKPNFGESATEMDTLRAPTNYQAYKVFGGMTAAQIKASAAKVLAVTDADIDAAVARNVVDPARAAKFAQVLKARRDDIKTRVDALTATEAAEKAVSANAIETAIAKGLAPAPPKPAPPVVVPPPPPPVAPPPDVPVPPEKGTKSKVPLAKGIPVVASTNPDPIPLGSKLTLDSKLHLEVVGNPKIATAAVRFSKYKDGMTLQQYVDAVGDKSQALKDVAWDMKQGWISASRPGAVEKASAALAKAKTDAASTAAQATADTSAYADAVYGKLKSALDAPLPAGPQPSTEVGGAAFTGQPKTIGTDGFKQVAAANNGPLPEFTNKALSSYQKYDTAKILNKTLADGSPLTPSQKSMVEDLDAGIANYGKMKEDAVLFGSLTPAAATSMSKLAPGDTIVVPSYGGYGYNKSDLTSPSKMRINVPKGTPALHQPNPNYGDDAQVLLQRGHQLKYTGFKDGEFHFDVMPGKGSTTTSFLGSIGEGTYTSTSLATATPAAALAGTKAAVAAGEGAGLIAKGSAVVVPPPSPPVAYESAYSGTTAVDKASKDGVKGAGIDHSALNPDLAMSFKGSVVTSLEKVGASTKTSSGVSPMLVNAGAQVEAAALLSKSKPTSTLLAYAYSNNKYVGAVAASIEGEKAVIKHLGSLKSGAAPGMIESLADQAGKKGLLSIEVKTASPEVYLKAGFQPTAVKDVYSLSTASQAGKYNAASVAVGDGPLTPVSAPVDAAAKAKQSLISTVETATPTPNYDASPGTKVETKGKVLLATTAAGHKFDAAGGGGAAALDPKTLAATPQGTQNAQTKLSDADFVKANSFLIEKNKEVTSSGKLSGDYEALAISKMQKILVQSDLDNPADGSKLYGLVLNSKGELKGAVAATTSPDSTSVVITDHASLGGGSGTPALNKLVQAAQAAGKQEVLVKSGLTDYYKAQGFTASVDAEGYLTLNIDPVKYKPPSSTISALSSTAYGSLSPPSEALLKQLVKAGPGANVAHVDVAKYGTVTSGTADYQKFKQESFDDDLEPGEQSSATKYTGNYAFSLNKKLYTDAELTDDDKKHVKNIDAALKKASLKRDVVLWRAVNKEEFQSFFEIMTAGDVFVAKGFNSGSVTKGIFGSGSTYKTTMKIYANKGASAIPVGSISKHGSEDEVIMPRNAPFRFLGKDAEGNFEFEYV